MDTIKLTLKNKYKIPTMDNKKPKINLIAKQKTKLRIQKLNEVSKDKKRLIHNLMQQLQKMQKQ